LLFTDNVGAATEDGGRMFCSGCGTEAADDSAYCSKCGKALTAESSPSAEPVVIKGITFTPGTGEYAGFYSAKGHPWVRIVDGEVVKAKPGASRRLLS